jgi:hypothetical protein
MPHPDWLVKYLGSNTWTFAADRPRPLKSRRPAFFATNSATLTNVPAGSILTVNLKTRTRRAGN